MTRRNIYLATTVAVIVLASGCSTTPAPQATAGSQPVQAQPARVDCKSDCVEDDENRYRYNLGILSVILMG